MRSRMLWTLFPFLLVMLFVCSSQAQAEVSIGIGIGGGHHYYRDGGVVTYRTADPVYTTWYPDSTPTYVAPPVYYSDPYPTYYSSPTYYSTPYVYRAEPSVSFGAFFGSGDHRSYDRGGRGGRRR
jgi:hypothetical protein